MHGVRRGSRPRGAAAQEAEERARHQALLLRNALAARQATDTNAEPVVRAAVEANPDEYSLWAFRRELLERSQDDQFDQKWQDEIALTMIALGRHPKAYPAWQHRLWLLEEPRVVSRVDRELYTAKLAEEEKLSAYMLQRDGRNFHGWAHRMRVRAISDATTEQSLNSELTFVTEKINTDFANYSAWHQRSAILPKLRELKHLSKEDAAKVLAEELHFVRQAFYTEPDVQSAWFYHRWLLAGMPARGMKAGVDKQLWRNELHACNELLEIEPDARWALHTKSHILTHLSRHKEAIQVLQRLKELVSFHGFCCLSEGLY